MHWTFDVEKLLCCVKSSIIHIWTYIYTTSCTFRVTSLALNRLGILSYRHLSSASRVYPTSALRISFPFLVCSLSTASTPSVSTCSTLDSNSSASSAIGMSLPSTLRDVLSAFQMSMSWSRSLQCDVTKACWRGAPVKEAEVCEERWAMASISSYNVRLVTGRGLQGQREGSP